MINKKTAAVFPVFSDTIAVIRYLYSYSDEYEVKELLSPAGCGFCGEDASVADNRDKLGILVSDYKQSTYKGWDTLILLQHSDATGESFVSIRNDVIKRSAMAGKEIVMAPEVLCEKENSNTDECGIIKEYCIRTHGKSENIFDKTTLDAIGIQGLRNPHVFTVLVGELIKDNSGVFPFLKLYRSVSRHANTLAITTETNMCICGAYSLQPILSSKKLSERDKVLCINKYVSDLCDIHKPDYILIYIDRPILAYNDQIFGDFGISMYILAQALNIDYFVCSIPSNYFNALYIDELSQYSENCFGTPIDYATISNSFVDDVVMPNAMDVPSCHLNSTQVDNVLKSCSDTLENIDIGDLNIDHNIASCLLAIESAHDTMINGPIVFCD